MELTAQEAWSKILESARTKLPGHSYHTWLAPTQALALSEDTLVIAAPSLFAAEWIEDKYGELLLALTRRILGKRFQLSVEARADGSQPEPLAAHAPPELQEIGSDSPAAEPPASKPVTPVIGKLNPRLTLARFVIGRSNEFAAALCQAVGDLPGRHYNPLFIHGGVGLGKTHLLHAIGNRVLERFPGTRVAYLSAEQFTNELIDAIRGRRTAEFHARYRRLDVLLLDDAHFVGGKDSTQEELFHTFNTLHDARKQIVLASDRPPKEIPRLQERLVSRFEWGVVTEISRPDLETRVAILQRKADDEELAIPYDVLIFIAERCRSSVRELEGALIKILAYSSLTRQDVTPQLASSLIGSSLRPQGAVEAAEIEAAVAQAFGVSVTDLHSKSRQRRLTEARHIAMYLLKSLLDLPYTEIGRRFGGRDHSTVIHSIQKIEKQIAENSEVRRTVERLRERFT